MAGTNDPGLEIILEFYEGDGKTPLGRADCLARIEWPNTSMPIPNVGDVVQVHDNGEDKRPYLKVLTRFINYIGQTVQVELVVKALTLDEARPYVYKL